MTRPATPQLYHNAFSTCSQKVRLALAARQVRYESKEIDLMAGEQFSESYMAINPAAVVPALIVDGRVIAESSVTNEYINDSTQGAPMLPSDSVDRALARHRSGRWTISRKCSIAAKARPLRVPTRSMDSLYAHESRIGPSIRGWAVQRPWMTYHDVAWLTC